MNQAMSRLVSTSTSPVSTSVMGSTRAVPPRCLPTIRYVSTFRLWKRVRDHDTVLGEVRDVDGPVVQRVVLGRDALEQQFALAALQGRLQVEATRQLRDVDGAALHWQSAVARPARDCCW